MAGRRTRELSRAHLTILCAVTIVTTAHLLVAAPRAQTVTSGRISGRVRLTGAAPPNPPIRMGVDPACSQIYSSARPVQPFVVRDVNGGLANAFVHLRGEFADAPPASSAPVVIEQQACVYAPHVVGVRVGQALQVRNVDPTSHNVHSVSQRGNDYNVTQPRGGSPVLFTPARSELMLRLTCDVHSWMNVFVGVMPHPYFAVSATDGRFEIANVPPGEFEAEVWHERFGTLTARVNVVAGSTANVEFTYSGRERPAAPVATRRVPAPLLALQ